MKRKLLFLFGVAAVLVFFDQWSKYVVVRELTTQFDGRETFGERLAALYGDPPPAAYDGLHFRPKRFITISENFFHIRYAENPGAAWGMLRGVDEKIRGPFFHLVSIAAIIFITSYFLKLHGTPEEKWAYFGLPLVLGGALGNYVDRFARGFVIDFLEAHWFDKATWPSFNVADTAICVGIGMLVVDSFVRKEKRAPVPAGS